MMTDETITTTPTGSPPPLLRALVDHRNSLQAERIRWGNRIAAIDRGDSIPLEQELAMARKWHEVYERLESDADAEIVKLVKDHPMMKQLKPVKGIGPLIAAKMLSMIDIYRADSVSALWRYAGYAVIDGTRERPTKGEKLHYNIRLKTTMYLAAGSFLKSNSPYRRVYDSAKAYYQANRPEWTKAHIHAASMRKMIKVFLSHVWSRWRQIEGLPLRDLYVTEKLGHTTYFSPEEFGWEPYNG
jgi:hypothetical protein